MVPGREFSSENLSGINVSILLEKMRMNSEVTAFYKVSGEHRRQGPYESWQLWTVHPRDIKSQMKSMSGSGFCTMAAFCTVAGRQLGLNQISAPDYVARLQTTQNSLNLGFL